MLNILSIYKRLMEAYGPQGWWPLLDVQGTNPTKTGAMTGYHVGDYSYPRNEAQRFEICVGAVLTQNTAWTNVEKALRQLAEGGMLEPGEMLAAADTALQNAIRPSGYFNVKARKLREFAAFYLSLAGRCPSRDELLGVWGIGPETADSIRLYAYGQVEFVVDAYTRRILAHLGIVAPKASYGEIKSRCIQGLPSGLPAYQEFHALVVEHAKRCYCRRPYCDALLAGE